MYQFRLEKPDRLKESQRLAYESLAQNKAELKILQGKHRLSQHSDEFFLLGAYQQRELIGCLAFSLMNAIWTADLQYIYVKPAYRKQGIGLKLLQELKAALIRRKILACWFRYTDEAVDKQGIEHLFAKANWRAPRCEMERGVFDIQVANPPWLHRPYRLPEGFTLFPWHELTDDDRRFLKHRESQYAIPEGLSPFSTKYALEPLNSLGIRYQGEVVSWLITRRLDRETILYSALYAESDVRFKGCGLALLTEAIRLQKASSVRWAVCEFNFQMMRPSLRHFFKTYLLPFADRIEHQMVTSLNFSAS